MTFLSISQAADQIGVPPRLISDLFWQRLLDREQYPLIGTRRCIPLERLDDVRAVLRSRGKLPKAEAVTS